ncbi:MAG: hypothetical protein RLZZ299_1989 [Pseudomonadota bacterium]|jgi:Lon protease-like protein
MDRVALARACATLPIFPLPGVQLMPGALLPLHVFEPRYRQLVADCVRDQTPLCVPQLVSVRRDDGAGPPAVHPYAVVGVLAAHQPLQDGRSNILVQPVARVRIVEERDVDTPYRAVRAVPLDDLPVDAAALGAVGARVRALVLPMLGAMGASTAGLTRALRMVPDGRLAEAVATLVLRDEDARQRFLAQDSPLTRAHQVEEAVLTLAAEGRGGVVAEA